MAVGTVSTRILADVANSICCQAGVATIYKPRQMAAAVAALDGTDAGSYQAQPYMTFDSGVLPESVLSDIADAMRGQNGLSTLYAPGEMTTAVLALAWDVGFKIRGLLLDDGTLEINYYERRTSVIGGRIVRVFEIDSAGYSSASARLYDSIKLLVEKVYIDSTIGALGLAHVQQLQPSGWRDGRLRTFLNEWRERVQAGRGRRAGRVEQRCSCRFYAHFYEDGGGVLTATPMPESSHSAYHWRDLRHRQVRGAGFHALGRRHRADAPPAPHERDLCG